MKRNTVACLESWSEELISRAERVRKLIGDAHWLSDGHHKEELVRQFLLRHLPPTLRVSRGFICPPDDNSRVSSEIDVLVTDTLSEMPWFIEGSLVIAPPSCVRGQLHVKTEFNVEELADVFASGARNHQLVSDNTSETKPWFGALFFAQTKVKNANRLSQIISSGIAKALTGQKQYNLTRDRFPDCIAIIGGPVFLADKTQIAGSVDAVTIRGFDSTKLSSAILLAHLFDSIQIPGRDLTRRGEWSQLLASAEIPSLFVKSFELVSKQS